MPSLREEIANIIGHLECEDCWYSCPKSREGCCNDEAGDDCTCGAERWVDEIVKLIERRETGLRQQHERDVAQLKRRLH